MSYWKPKEIIVDERVRQDPVTTHVLQQCEGVPVRYAASGKYADVVGASSIISEIYRKSRNGEIQEGELMAPLIAATKQVLYIAPVGDNDVDEFKMDDDRMMCPHFKRLKFALNGCFYRCDWCYLKLTYRSAHPYITIRAEYDELKRRIQKELNKSEGSVIFNSGELADSLSMEHLTHQHKNLSPGLDKQRMAIYLCSLKVIMLMAF